MTVPFNRPAQVEKKEDRNQDRNNYRKNKDALKNKVVGLIKNNPTITIINSAKAANAMNDFRAMCDTQTGIKLVLFWY